MSKRLPIWEHASDALLRKQAADQRILDSLRYARDKLSLAHTNKRIAANAVSAFPGNPRHKAELEQYFQQIRYWSQKAIFLRKDYHRRTNIWF